MPPPLPVNVLPCPGGDVIIDLRGMLTARLDLDQQRALAQLLLNGGRPTTHRHHQASWTMC